MSVRTIRRRTYGRRSIRRKGNLTWITVVVKASVLENVATQIAQLVIPSDWSIATGFDRATLLAVRGWLTVTQQGAATAAEATAAYWAVACQDVSSADVMNPSVASDYDDYDVLYSGGLAMTAAASTASLVAPALDVQFKSKRRLTSQEEVSLFCFVDIDTATPRANFNGVLRALIRTE